MPEDQKPDRRRTLPLLLVGLAVVSLAARHTYARDPQTVTTQSHHMVRMDMSVRAQQAPPAGGFHFTPRAVALGFGRQIPAEWVDNFVCRFRAENGGRPARGVRVGFDALGRDAQGDTIGTVDVTRRTNAQGEAFYLGPPPGVPLWQSVLWTGVFRGRRIDRAEVFCENRVWARCVANVPWVACIGSEDGPARFRFEVTDPDVRGDVDDLSSPEPGKLVLVVAQSQVELTMQEACDRKSARDIFLESSNPDLFDIDFILSDLATGERHSRRDFLDERLSPRAIRLHGIDLCP